MASCSPRYPVSLPSIGTRILWYVETTGDSGVLWLHGCMGACVASYAAENSVRARVPTLDVCFDKSQRLTNNLFTTPHHTTLSSLKPQPDSAPKTARSSTGSKGRAESPHSPYPGSQSAPHSIPSRARRGSAATASRRARRSAGWRQSGVSAASSPSVSCGRPSAGKAWRRRILPVSRPQARGLQTIAPTPGSMPNGINSHS